MDKEERVRRDEARRAIRSKFEEDIAPLKKELTALGVNADDIRLIDVRSMTAEEYAPLLAIFLHYFAQPLMPLVRETIARSMVAARAKQLVWPHLLRLYKVEDESEAQNGLAASLGELAKTEDLDEVISLFYDTSRGPSRILLTHFLARSRQPRALEALETMKDDPDLHIEIAHILKKKARYAEKKAEKDAAKQREADE